MESKIIINRYEEGKETQSMEIKLVEEIVDNQLQTKKNYGSWSSGEILYKAKQPKLLVDVVDIYQKEDMDLDLISKQVFFPNCSSNNQHILDQQYDPQETIHCEEYESFMGNIDRKSISKIDEISKILSKKAEITDGQYNTTPKDQNDLDLLDQKLERIRKNNEKIMENILILNKTLDYTRKKEIEESMSARLAMVSFVCDKCGKSFTKNSSFQYHMRQHKLRYDDTAISNSYKSNKPWVCPFCYQVWPSEVLLKEHLARSECLGSGGTAKQLSVEEILQHAQKTHITFLMQCEFCQKLFPSVAKALKHGKGHSTQRNYECTECVLAFRDYETAMQHWQRECPWLDRVYSFSLDKYFACNICYEKFDKLENLYNHRYENEHFMLKRIVAEQNKSRKFQTVDNHQTQNIETLRCHWQDMNLEVAEEYLVRTKKEKPKSEMIYQVYQCEMCGFVCEQIPSLLIHRDEGHSALLCQVCGEISEDRISFFDHMERHSFKDLNGLTII